LVCNVLGENLIFISFYSWLVAVAAAAAAAYADGDAAAAAAAAATTSATTSATAAADFRYNCCSSVWRSGPEPKFSNKNSS